MITIHAKDYQKVLQEIRSSMALAQDKIARSKVEMAWKIGRVIEKTLPQSDKEKYGQKLVEQLERDVSINASTLYKMHSFYQSYPKLPKDDPKLNWSHYRVLSGVKDVEKRRMLEDLTTQNLLSSAELQKEVTKGKKSAPKPQQKKGEIQPTRGKIFTYKIIDLDKLGKGLIDCGFKIFREVKEVLPKDSQVVFVSKKNDRYSLRKSNIHPQQIYTYKAFLKRVVDGDTLHAYIDLGFGMFHEEIIRLAKINTSEAKTDGGKVAKVELEKILNSVPFFILKSIKTDIFNRYVADIFLPENAEEDDLQKVANDGIYLNQMLLDRGLAEIF
ncbi:MAG: hypothetical protein KGP29_03500 [Proteobacteria bacterium]|nr:hypothetical protein [Pseudomonadota bacterium]